jgi:glucokinase-like ROK family protein
MVDTNFSGQKNALMKEHNIRVIQLNLLYEGSLSRIQLAQKTSLSATTITNLVDELIEKGIVSECITPRLSSKRKVGRPQLGLCLVKDARFSLGVHMRMDVYRIAILNLLGEVVDWKEFSFSTKATPLEVIDDIAKNSEKLISKTGIDRQRIIGVGVGASGLVDYKSGVNILATNFGWKDVPMREWLMDRLGLPIVVDNNVRCMALGEAIFGVGRGIKSLVFIYGRFGVGAGIVVNGEVFRGSGLGAGEVGHTIILSQNGQLCRCGQHGCLETLVSEPSLIEQGIKLAETHPNSLLAEQLNNSKESSRIKRLFNAVRLGDPHAKQLVEQSARYLGIALANVVNLVNPEIILLGGLFDEESEIILPIARHTMETTAFGGLGQKAKLHATSFGWKAGMIGAGTLALSKFFYMNFEDF